MEMFNNIILNLILILFPLLIYFVYICYQQINRSNQNIPLIEISIVTSIYLCLKFGYFYNLDELLLFCDIPIIISYIKRKDKLSVLLSLLLLCYFHFKFNIGLYIILMSLKYISFFVVYKILRKKNNNKLIITDAVIQGFFTSISIYIKANNTYYHIIDIFWLIIIFIIASFFVLYLFKMIDSLSGIFISIKDLEKDKQIKNSLFKLTHEIKNPLAVCKGYLQMINFDEKEKLEKYIEIIKSEIDRSLLIMADFKELNKITISKELVDLNYLVEEVYDSLSLLIIDKEIKIHFENNEELYVNIDYLKIKQVLINIIKNSTEAIMEKGIISIKTYQKNKYAYIIIEDNGIGMDEESLTRINELFFTTKKNGTGLGVVLSNEIVSAHNGEIKYESKINVGTKVIIKLPIK